MAQLGALCISNLCATKPLPDVIYNELKDHLKKKLNEINVLGKVVHDFREYNLVEPDVLTVLDTLKIILI